MAEKAKEEKKEETTALSVPENFSVMTGAALDSSDIEIPRLNIIQKTSQIDGDTGSVVIDKESMILPAATKVPTVIIGAAKKWHEDVPFDDDTVPRIALTKGDADALAEESSYEVIEFAEIGFLIPEHEYAENPDVFQYPIGDRNWAVGRITVQKDAYRNTYKRLGTFALFNKGVPHCNVFWNFSSELITKGKYSWFVPMLSATKEETPAEVREFVLRMHGVE